ncbi:MAG: hypothetical protein M3Z75_14770 [Actinomycetota bacterium]|nr:hypothetical protein [Actinomycetota bacterium]
MHAGDEPRFQQDLARVLDRVRILGTPVPENHLAVSGFILLGPRSSLTEVLALPGEEGLIPG